MYNPTMPHCKPCGHPLRTEIDTEIVKGVPLRVISQAFTISTGSLCRHKAHIRADLALAIQSQPGEREERGSALYNRIEKLVCEAEAILVSAKAKEDFRGANGALGAAAKLLDLCARLSGELQVPNSGGIHLTKITNVNVNNYDDKELAGLLKEATCGWNPAVIARFQALTDSPESAITRP